MIKLFTKKRKGFTLIELIVVIAILAILAAIAIPRLTGFSADAAAKADDASIRTIQSAVSIAEANNDLNLATTDYTADELFGILVPEYLNEIPKSQTGAGWTVGTDSNSGALTITVTAGTAGGDAVTGTYTAP